MAFDIDGARKAGYSDDEIAGFLGEQSGFDTAGAFKSGYSAGEVVGFLSSQNTARRALPAGVTPSSAGAGRGDAWGDPRRTDAVKLPAETKPSVLQDAPQEFLPGNDPMLKPEFVDGFRAELGKMPLENRMAALRAYADTDKGVYGRAAKVILAQATRENEDYIGKDTDRETARLLNAAPPVKPQPAPPGLAPRRKTAFPDANNALTGYTAKEVAQTNATAQTLEQSHVQARNDMEGAAARNGFDSASEMFKAQERARNRAAFAQDNPNIGGLASGSAQSLRGLINAPTVAAGFLNKTVVDPLLGLAGAGPMPAVPTTPGTEALSGMAAQYMPEVGKLPMGKAWDDGVFSQWLAANVSAQVPQMAQSVYGVMNPAALPAILPMMGAAAAGGAFADGDDPRAAVAKGMVEMLSEGASFGVAAKVKSMLQGLTPSAQQSVFKNIAGRAAAVGGALTAQHLAGAVEESVAQLGGNAIDIYASGKDKRLTDGVGQAAVLGAVTNTAMALPNVLDAARDNSPQARAARELAAQLDGGSFRPTDSDYATANPHLVGVPARTAPRVEDMPTTPVVPTARPVNPQPDATNPGAPAIKVEPGSTLSPDLAQQARTRISDLEGSPVDNIAALLGQKAPDARNAVAPAAEPGASPGSGRAVDAGGVQPGGFSPVAAGRAGAVQPAGAPVAGVAEAGAVAVPDSGPAPVATLNDNGTATIKGEPQSLIALLRANGVTAILPARNGVVVGKSQAEQAQRVVADFSPAQSYGGQQASTTAAPVAPLKDAASSAPTLPEQASAASTQPQDTQAPVAERVGETAQPAAVAAPARADGGVEADGIGQRPRLTGDDLVGKSYDDLNAMHQEARDNNRAVDLGAIRKFWGAAQAKEAEGWTTRQRERWLTENETDEASDWMQSRYIDDELIKEHRNAANDFDTDGPVELGRSIGVRSKDVDKPGFFATPPGVAFANAMRYAKEQGWDLNKVMEGMRSRSAEWAGNDAAELFTRLWKASATPTAVDAQPAISTDAQAGENAERSKPPRPTVDSQGNEIDRQGLTSQDRYRATVDSAATELAGQVQEESEQEDFDPADMPQVIEAWAKQSKVAADDLRSAFEKRISAASSFRRKAGVLKAINPIKQAGKSGSAPNSAPAPRQRTDLESQAVDLRKRKSVLESLAKCLGG